MYYGCFMQTKSWNDLWIPLGYSSYLGLKYIRDVLDWVSDSPIECLQRGLWCVSGQSEIRLYSYRQRESQEPEQQWIQSIWILQTTKSWSTWSFWGSTLFEWDLYAWSESSSCVYQFDCHQQLQRHWNLSILLCMFQYSLSLSLLSIRWRVHCPFIWFLQNTPLRSSRVCLILVWDNWFLSMRISCEWSLLIQIQ